MFFNGSNPDTFTPELADLLRSVQNLTRGSYDEYDKNYKTLSTMLKRIIKISKQENEWSIYFHAIVNLMYLDERSSNYNYKEIIKYAEVYYKDSALYMDKMLPNYSRTTMGFTNVWICKYIFNVYFQCCEIDDAKMDAFMRKYEDVAYKYGERHHYYNAEMEMGILYHDKERAKEAARKFKKHEREITGCYVCEHRLYLAHFFLLGNAGQAETLMLDLIHKNIPKQYLSTYQYCESAEPARMYERVLRECVWNGKKDLFDYFFKKYWSELPHENRHNSDSFSFKRLLCAFEDDFEEYEDDLQYTLECIDDEKKETTLGNMRVYLDWWCYYILLDKSGVHSVSIALPELEADENGQVSALAVSTYMEKKADTFGIQFAKARAAFDYEFVKNAYRKCFLSFL